eukprot:227705-Prorocentrum_minimum.AAC.2
MSGAGLASAPHWNTPVPPGPHTGAAVLVAASGTAACRLVDSAEARRPNTSGSRSPSMPTRCDSSPARENEYYKTNSIKQII